MDRHDKITGSLLAGNESGPGPLLMLLILLFKNEIKMRLFISFILAIVILNFPSPSYSSKKSTAEELKAEKLSTKPTPTEVMIYCASQDNLYQLYLQFPNKPRTALEKASDRTICEKFSISESKLTDIY